MSKGNDAILIAYSRGYRVNKEGKLFNSKQKELKPYLRPDGYRNFNIRIGKERVTISIHRLQAFQKYGTSIFNPNIVVRHLNGNPEDCTYDNILIGSHSDNMNDIPEDVRMKNALYATSFVRKWDKEIIKTYYNEYGFKKTMDHFGISSKGTMSYIINH